MGLSELTSETKRGVRAGVTGPSTPRAGTRGGTPAVGASPALRSHDVVARKRGEGGGSGGAKQTNLTDGLLQL
eukprot:1138441-Rhodomonas_salina.3